METRANYVVIGLFTLGVALGLFGFVYWFQNLGGAGERAFYRVAFEGSVSGLRTGGTVLFNGIRVGEVSKLEFDAQQPQQVIATISVAKSVPVRRDTQISLEFQGLTGIASLALRGGSAAAPILAGDRDNPPLLTAPPGATEDITQAARDALRRLDLFLAENQKALHGAIENIDTFTGSLAANSKRIDSAAANIDKFSGALARNSDRIDQITEGLQNLTGGLDGKGGEINEAAKSIRRLADSLDERAASITTGVNKFTAQGSRAIDRISSDAHRTLTAIERMARNIDRNPSRLLFGGQASSTPQRR